MTYIQTSVMQAKNVRTPGCLWEQTAPVAVWCGVGKPSMAPSLSVECTVFSSNIKLWREVNSSHGALLLLSMCFPHGSPPPHQIGAHLHKMCVSRAELTCSARMQKAFRWQTSPRAVICHWEQRGGGGGKRKEGTAALLQQRDWEGKKEGVRNRATVLGTQ